MKWQKSGRLILTLLLLVLPAACGGNPMPAEPAVPVPEETGAGGGALCPPAVSGGQCDRA